MSMVKSSASHLIIRSALTIPPWWQLWQVPVFALGLSLILGLWATRPLWYDPEIGKFERRLSVARKTLDDPAAPVNQLTELLTAALNEIDKRPDLAGEVQFLLGSVYVRQADHESSDNRPELWRNARSHLESAEALGVADNERMRLRYRLAKSWFHTGGDPAKIIQYLNKSVDDGDDRFEGYGLLAQAYLQLPAPDFKAALDAAQKQVQLPIEDERKVASARLLQGELLLRLNEPGSREAARKTLGRITSEAPAAIISRARFLSARSHIDDHNWQEALELLEQMTASHQVTAENSALFWYWSGLCCRNLNRPADAIRAWEKAALLTGEPSQAAGLLLADACREAGKFTQALEAFNRALAGIAKPEDYSNSLLDISQVQSLLSTACRTLEDTGLFENAIQAARLYGRLSAKGPAKILLGQIAETWAKASEGQGRALSPPDRQQSEEKAHQHFREAGAAYECAAEAAGNTAEKTDWLWRAAACFRQGEEHRRTVAVLDRFINLRPQDRLGEAWFRLGEAHHALHNDTAARLSYLRCIESAGPFAYRARYQLAVAEVERGNLADAEAILTQNLDVLRIETDREAHENTLFLLAEILFRLGKYRPAALRWEQALLFYPASPNAPMARFYLSECYRRLADEEALRLPMGRELNFQEHYRKHYGIWLEQAAANYQKLVDDLEARRMAGSLSQGEEKLLRDALFNLAQCRFDRGQYEEAAQLFDGLASRFEQTYDGFVALKQLYRCRILVIPWQVDKALAVLDRARTMLNGLNDSAFDKLSPSESREESEKWVKEQEVQLRPQTTKQ
jgi:TolA-binding protein